MRYQFPPRELVELIPVKGLRVDGDSIVVEELCHGIEKGQAKIRGRLCVSIKNSDLLPCQSAVDPNGRTTLPLYYENFYSVFRGTKLQLEDKNTETLNAFAAEYFHPGGPILVEDLMEDWKHPCFTVMVTKNSRSQEEFLVLSLLKSFWDKAGVRNATPTEPLRRGKRTRVTFS